MVVVSSSSSGQSARLRGGSWLPKHKCADPQIGREDAQRGGITFPGSAKTTRLATKPGISLREEVVEEGGGDRRAVSWARATREWRAWLKEAKDTRAVFENEEGEQASVPLENRFMGSRQKAVYAKFHDVARGAREAYGDRLNTAMLTFTASTKSGAGDWDRTPGNHLDDLLGSWPAVRRELHRVLGAREWEYARILEPHESGHAHVHLAVFVRGPVTGEMFRPVMRAHVENTMAAGWEAHRPEGDAVSVRGSRESGAIENVAAYLSSYVMNYGEDALEGEEHEQRFNALLWATGRRRWSLSAGAQEWAAFEPPESVGDWEMVAVEIRGAKYDVSPKSNTTVFLDLDESGSGLDPPPDRGVV